MACFMNLFTEQREGGEHTSRYLRLAVETSSLVSLVEKRPSLLTISSQRRSSSTPFRIPSCPAQKSEHAPLAPREPNFLALMRRTTRRPREGGNLVEGGAGGEAVEPGRPVEEGGEREVGVVLRLWMEAHLRLHLVPDLLHLHHFDR